MAQAVILLAEGFEEIEALTPLDILRRAGISACALAMEDSPVTGAHGIAVVPDEVAKEGYALPEDAEVVVLPGGSPGTDNLKQNPLVWQILQQAVERNIYIGAICAAPTVLQKYGLLRDKRVTAFPATQPELGGTNFTGMPLEVDGHIITSRAAGTALEFSHALVRALAGKETADKVVAAVYPRTMPGAGRFD